MARQNDAVTNSTRLCAVLGASVVAAMLLFLGSAAAAPGDLDPTFGTGGVVETAIGSAASARAMVLQPDGKIVLAEQCVPGRDSRVARYSPDGRLDPTFGTGGFVTGPEGTALAVAIQPDGRIVTAGRNNNTDYVMTVTRYLPNGNIDSAFGSGGVAARFLPGDANAVAIQADGKILVAGGSPDPNMGSSNEFTLIRFLSGGTPDPDFGSNGVVRTRVGSSDTAWGLALQANGKIVAGGSGGVDELRMAIARYEPNGELDPTFGANGVVTRFSRRAVRSGDVHRARHCRPSRRCGICRPEGRRCTVPGRRQRRSHVRRERLDDRGQRRPR